MRVIIPATPFPEIGPRGPWMTHGPISYTVVVAAFELYSILKEKNGDQ